MRIHREILNLLLLLLLSIGARAQDERFIYFQSDHQQPFYIRTENRVYSSSEAGYIIISSIPEGHAFAFTLGFPKNSWPSQQYIIDPLQKDMGFKLAQQDSSNWSLYDLQSNNLFASVAHAQVSAGKMTLSDDEFTNVLAEVSHTPSLREKRIKPEVSEVTAIVPAITEVNTNSVQQVTQPSDATLQANNTASQTTVIEAQPITPISSLRKQTEYLTDSGRIIQYVITEGDQISTVDVFIPVDKPIQALDASIASLPSDVVNVDNSNNKDALPQNVVKPSDTVSIIHQDSVSIQNAGAANVTAIGNEPKTDSSSINGASTNTTQDSSLFDQRSSLIQSSDTSNSKVPVALAETICSAAATEKDFLELRRAMVKEDDELRMLETVRNAMKEKCFVTEQLRNLAVLFLSEDNRLSFLLSSYRYCIDKENYTSLSNLLNQEKSINTFKEQIH